MLSSCHEWSNRSFLPLSLANYGREHDFGDSATRRQGPSSYSCDEADANRRPPPLQSGFRASFPLLWILLGSSEPTLLYPTRTDLENCNRVLAFLSTRWRLPGV